MLTHKSLSILSGPLQEQGKEMRLLHKIDYDYATCMAKSNSSLFVGDGKGTIEVVEIGGEEERLVFGVAEGTGELRVSQPRKKKTLVGSKHPVSSLAFI